jgi:hypothetical protein
MVSLFEGLDEKMENSVLRSLFGLAFAAAGLIALGPARTQDAAAGERALKQFDAPGRGGSGS